MAWCDQAHSADVMVYVALFRLHTSTCETIIHF